MHEFLRRRTFAVISHPDAGKTTLTEKLLLYGGAIHAAGAVRARKNQRAATSDWMELERKRGISITTSVLPFESKGIRFNLLDTPGHQDFSEDTYRTLTAADCAIMLIDAAKGVEEQTKKLFHVCRMRGIPIVTFVNKLDRPARDPFSLMSEIEETLGMRAVPRTWPIGSGERFQGVYELDSDRVLLFDRTAKNASRAPVRVRGIEDAEIDALIGSDAARQLREEIELIREAGDRFDKAVFLQGRISPLFFGSALTSFGVEPFLEAFAELCPPPGPRETSIGRIEASDERFSAFVFKVQANMDPNHRDRVAFIRICSGKFESGMRVHHFRLGKEIRLARAEQLFADERTTIHEAWPGDIVGLHDPGIFRIGDTLTTGTPFTFDAVPRFSPEHFARAVLLDPLKRKQMQKGIEELAEEGALQLFFQPGREKDPIIGVVGQLQFDVFVYRMEHEYGAKISLERLPYVCARWVVGAQSCAELEARRVPMAVTDIDGRPVALFPSEWDLRRVERDNPQWSLLPTAPMHR
ncbi:MAG: peptide chain release factor 3 [Sandaracinaceae bacterium]|nr:peptide chain release factor 3 [Sandaracinaceae bacterium]MDW8246751.1 peptide chain release factor 3 [Sandaracinaceae bacterium]